MDIYGLIYGLFGLLLGILINIIITPILDKKGIPLVKKFFIWLGVLIAFIILFILVSMVIKSIPDTVESVGEHIRQVFSETD